MICTVHAHILLGHVLHAARFHASSDPQSMLSPCPTWYPRYDLPPLNDHKYVFSPASRPPTPSLDRLMDFMQVSSFVDTLAGLKRCMMH